MVALRSGGCAVGVVVRGGVVPVTARPGPVVARGMVTGGCEISRARTPGSWPGRRTLVSASSPSDGARETPVSTEVVRGTLVGVAVRDTVVGTLVGVAVRETFVGGFVVEGARTFAGAAVVRVRVTSG